MSKEFKNMRKCICEWGTGWGSCKNYIHKNKQKYGGCFHWVKTDFYEYGVRHPGWCKRMETSEAILNKELFEI